MIENPDEVIEQIIKHYPASQWLEQIKKIMPEADEGFVVSTIEILCGGDLKPIQ